VVGGVIMAVRNSRELGKNLFTIANRLLCNQNLLKYLKYTDTSPLNNENVEDPISTILHQNIKVVPLVNEEENGTESTIVLLYKGAGVDDNNSEFKNVSLTVLVYTPLLEWQINDINLRPFVIMSEIEESLKDKRIDGLGTLKYLGFDLELLTDKISCYKMDFTLDTFN
jgi:hypothetical protein